MNFLDLKDKVLSNKIGQGIAITWHQRGDCSLTIQDENNKAQRSTFMWQVSYI